VRRKAIKHVSTHPKKVGAAKPCLGREKGSQSESQVFDVPVHGSLLLRPRPRPDPLRGSRQNSALAKNPPQSPVRMP
jgi:hypothetical protein